MKLLLAMLLPFIVAFADSLEQIRSKGVVRIGVYDGQPPFSELNDGTFEGFEVTMAQAIANDLFGEKGGRIELVPMKVEDRIPALVNNRVDIVIATITITPERAQQIDFSTPYFSVNLGVLTRKTDRIKSLADLREKRILLESGGTGEAFFKQEGFGNFTFCKIARECYRMLKDGDVDAYATDNLIAMAYPVVDSEVEVPLKTLGKPDFMGIGVQKGNKELLDFVNAELIKLSKEGFFEKAYEGTFNPFYHGAADKRYFLLDGIYSFL